MSNVKVVFSYQNHKGESKSQTVNASQFIQSGGKYMTDCTIIAPSDMSCPVSITIYDGDNAISDTLTYSIESYVYTRLQNSGNETFKSLITVLMKYAFAARTHFN